MCHASGPLASSISHHLHAFYNEGPSNDPRACAGYNASASAIRTLAPSSHRMVSWASCWKEADVCLAAADVVAFNDYPGWYGGKPVSAVNATWAAHAAWASAHAPTKPFLVAETGGGAIFEWARNGSAAEADGYTARSGALAAGSDLEMRVCGWEEAMVRCNASSACAGFTFESALARPPKPVRVYFKRVATEPNSDGRWRSWLKGAAPPPRWSQAYQEQLVGADVASALSLRSVSGISVWQLTDIKADDGLTKACGSCEYTTAYDATRPMNCSYIDARCFRPGGENHKGLVDFWRREKAAFGRVRKLFAAGGE